MFVNIREDVCVRGEQGRRRTACARQARRSLGGHHGMSDTMETSPTRPAISPRHLCPLAARPRDVHRCEARRCEDVGACGRGPHWDRKPRVPILSSTINSSRYPADRRRGLTLSQSYIRADRLTPLTHGSCGAPNHTGGRGMRENPDNCQLAGAREFNSQQRHVCMPSQTTARDA